MIDSFAVGNVIKNGIPVAIVGEPNVGKSTLLNALLNEERAIVSEIAGTTRDAIEDELAIGGIGFRFIDTAGIRETEDVVESMGIKRTFEKIEQAQVVLFLHSAEEFQNAEINLKSLQLEVGKIASKHPDKPLVIIVNKIDILNEQEKHRLEGLLSKIEGSSYKLISAKTGEGVEAVKNLLLNFVNTGALRNNETIVTNTRHYDALLKALEEVQKVQFGLDNSIPGDLLSIDIKQALFHFGEITGEITSDDLLGNIFANFCIGK